MTRCTLLFLLFLSLASAPLFTNGQTPVKLTLDFTQQGKTVSPDLFGLMTEEINFSYEGGIYAELIRNRALKDNWRAPDHWSVVKSAGVADTIALDHQQRLNDSINSSLRLHITRAGNREGIANEGYWDIPVKPQTTYQASFYAKASGSSTQPLTLSIESNSGDTVYATADVTGISGDWKRFTANLTTAKDIKPASQTRFVIATKDSGMFWFTMVSLFPPTFNNRTNGNRVDIMQMLAEMKPAFLRLPGGNYLEGDYFSTRFPWKETLGKLEDRKGHPSCWGYWSNDGMGLLEYLEWCEDLKMEPLLAVFAGYTLKGDYMKAGPFLQPFVDEALEEIEYVMGDVNTKWGARRAQDGHPEPFKLRFIEVGNEDGFDRSGSYEGRFTQFYDAIKAKYPQLQIISTVGGRDPLGKRFQITTRKLEIIDEHYYRTAWEMESDADHYDEYDRNGPKIFVGEWATREGSPTPNMNAALGDAAWMTGMLRNSDIVTLSSYAPLFVNVNPGGMQWASDLIGYDALTSYGSPSYYAQQMFSNYKGNKIIAVSAQNVPMQTKPASEKTRPGDNDVKEAPAMFYVATQDTSTGTVYLNVVNTTANTQSVNIALNGIKKVNATGQVTVLQGAKPEDTNTITEPKKIAPVSTAIKGISNNFIRTIPAYSINIFQIKMQGK